MDVSATHTPQELIDWSARVLNAFSHCDTVEDVEECARSTVQYFDALARCTKDEWLSEQPLKGWISRHATVHDGFSVVVDTLNNRSRNSANVLRALLVQHRWDPTPLLSSLDALFEQKDGAEHYWHNWYERAKNKAQSALLKTLLVGIDQGWHPPNLPVYGNMWCCLYEPGASGMVERLRVLREALPSGTHACLTALLCSTSVDPAVIPLLFPLSMQSCDSSVLAELLISLVTEGGQNDPTYKAVAVQNLLAQHHPEVSSLLSMHLDMIPGVSEQNTYYELLVEGINTILGRATKGIETLPLCLGDDMGMSF